jgi:acyl carrier protein
MLEFMGRQDRQVKVHGVRLEPGEIETVLRTHAQIADCAVIPVPGGSPGGNPSGRQEQHLYAYVVPRPGAGLMVDELWSFLARQIPIMLIPSNFYLLDHLPLTTNGKVDRKALLAVQSIEIRRQADFRKPYNAAEIQVVRIWEDLLGREGIDLDANFFFLGGHSLLAARMLGRVSDHFNIEIPLKTFLKQPTIAALADIIDSLHDLNRIPGDRPLEYEEGEI